MQMLEQYILKTGAKLCLIDAYREVMAGSDENAGTDNQLVLTALRLVCKRTGCAIILLHHTNKKGYFSGHTTIMTAIDSGLTIKSEINSPTINISTEKGRHIGDVGKDVIFNYLVDEDNPHTIVSYKITEVGKSPFEKEKKLHINDKHLQAFDYLKKHNNELVMIEYLEQFPEDEKEKHRNAVNQLVKAKKLVKDYEKSTVHKSVFYGVESSEGIEYDIESSETNFVDELIEKEGG